MLNELQEADRRKRKDDVLQGFFEFDTYIEADGRQCRYLKTAEVNGPVALNLSS